MSYYKIETKAGHLLWEGEAEDRNDAIQWMTVTLIIYEKFDIYAATPGADELSSSVAEYVKKWNRDPHLNFAKSCVDYTYKVACGLKELQEYATMDHPVQREVDAWGLVKGEWHDAVSAALGEIENRRVNGVKS